MRQGRTARCPPSDHRHHGAKAALQLPGQLMGRGYGHSPGLADGLAVAAHKDGEAFVAIGLDAIGVVVHHEGAALAAVSGADRHKERCEGYRPAHGNIEEARTAPAAALILTDWVV